ncbi:lipopolysaccharide biosynthesis protein [Mucilaginibacter flavidus]|uniref:lipopolysaccharide biosynthesis protein n=1 Tax=Mucilaginibacter flavidus TaxID=2949309 RepID=UPI0020938B5A|nr:lipopolysaccharide biosynthesis protein [Mucilaginibacter flavidus]
MSFKKGLFKNILISGGFNYLSQGINFLSTIILSRLLSPESYGVIGLITVFTNFIMVFSDGGLSYALIRSDYGRTYQRVLNNLSWLLGIILFLMTIALAYPISVFYKNPNLFWPTIVLSFTFLLRSLSLVQGAILAKQLRFATIGKVTLLGMVVSVSITIVLALLGAGYWALVFPQIVNAIIMAISYERNVKLGFKIYPLNYIKVGFKHTRKLVASVIGFNAINYWSRNSDNMIVGRVYGTSDLGLYSRAYSLLTLPLVLISGLFANILFPSLKRLKQEGGDIEQEYYFVLRVITLLSFPLVFILIAVPDHLVMLLWGVKWIKVAQFLPYFGLLIYTQTLLSTVGQLLILQGKERQYMISGWVSAFFLVGGIIFGSTISLIAVAQYYALSFLLAVLTFNMFYSYIKTLNFKTPAVLWFWAPKIFLSILLWTAIFFNISIIKFAVLIALFLSILFESRTEIKKLIITIQSKYTGA